MKNKVFKLFTMTMAVVLISTVSCKDSFLDVNPTGSLGQNELASLSGLEGLLIGTYSQLLGRSGFYSAADNWFWGSVLGADANKGTDEGDQSQVNEIQNYAAQTVNASVLQKYNSSYEGVARANNTLAVAAQATTVSAADLTRITAEARFLRGHYYFDLMINFRSVPIIDENWDGSDVPNNAGSGFDAALLNFIKADFEFAKANLPDVMSDAGRANKWAAVSYLGKAKLYEGDYSGALAEFNDAIANGVTASGAPYALLPFYGDLFRSTNDNNAESIFASQAAAGTGDVQNANPAMVLNFPHGSSGPPRPGGCCGFHQPSFDLVNAHRTVGGLPILDGTYNNSPLANDMNLSSADAFTVDASPVDPRLDHSVGRRGIEYLDWGPHPGRDWIRNQPNGGPFSPKKFSYYSAGNGVENDVSSWTPGYTAVNYNIIRFADVLLMAAEAEIELGNLDAGRLLINQVRARAATSAIPGSPATYAVSEYTSFADQAEARAAYQMERRIELAMEGHRKFDMVRWSLSGLFDMAAFLNGYVNYETQFISASSMLGATFTAGQDEFLPIPQNEIDLQGSGVLAQNPGY